MPNVNPNTSDTTQLKKMPTLLKVCLLWVCALFSTQSLALEYECSIAGDTRYLKVEIPGQERLCEVSVSYKSNGERRVMWYADNDTLFCSAKFYALKTKYTDLWNFQCEEWPDLDGIDQLSPTNRNILDVQLKKMITAGKAAQPAFTVKSVKAVASTLYDNKPGTLALQFFLSSGDTTQIVFDDGDSWKVSSTVDNLATHIVSALPVTTALISAINDAGALEIETTMASEDSLTCFGSQIVVANASNEITPSGEHEYICDTNLLSQSAVD